MLREHRFPDVLTCAAALADHVSGLLRGSTAAHGTASLIVSGGKTPLPFFERLQSAQIEWGRVTAGLADERWVNTEDPASNEGFVRKHLLQAHATAMHFVGLKNAAPSAAEGAALAWSRLSALRRPFDTVLLGMGDDGHTASLFPHSPALAAALEPGAAPACVAMHAPVAPRERLSLNLAALLETRSIVLLISGDDKWRIYERARDGKDVAAMPVRAVLRQNKVPVDVYACG